MEVFTRKLVPEWRKSLAVREQEADVWVLVAIKTPDNTTFHFQKSYIFDEPKNVQTGGQTKTVKWMRDVSVNLTKMYLLKIQQCRSPN